MLVGPQVEDLCSFHILSCIHMWAPPKKMLAGRKVEDHLWFSQILSNVFNWETSQLKCWGPKLEIKYILSKLWQRLSHVGPTKNY